MKDYKENIERIFEDLPEVSELLADSSNLKPLLVVKTELETKVIDEKDPIFQTEWIKITDFLNEKMILLKKEIQHEFDEKRKDPQFNPTALIKNLNTLNKDLTPTLSIPKYNDERSAYLEAMARLMNYDGSVNKEFLLSVEDEVNKTLKLRDALENEDDIDEVKKLMQMEDSIETDMDIRNKAKERVEHQKALCSMFFYYEDFEKLSQTGDKESYLLIDMRQVDSVEYDSLSLHGPKETSDINLKKQTLVAREGISVPLNSVVRVNFKDNSSLEFGPQGSVYLPVPSQELFNQPNTSNYKEFLKKEEHFIEYLLKRYEDEKAKNPNANISLNLNAIAGDSFREEYRDRLVKKLFEKYGATTSQKGAFNQKAFELNSALVRGGVLMESEGFKIMDKAQKPDSSKRSHALNKEALNNFLSEMKKVQSSLEKNRDGVMNYLLTKEYETSGQSKYMYAKEAANIVSYAAFSAAQLLYNVGSTINSGTTVDYTDSYGNVFQQPGLNKNFKDSFQHRLIKLLTSNHADLDKELNTFAKECGLKKGEVETFKQEFKALYHQFSDDFRNDFQKERESRQFSTRVKNYLFGNGAQSKKPGDAVTFSNSSLNP